MEPNGTERSTTYKKLDSRPVDLETGRQGSWGKGVMGRKRSMENVSPEVTFILCSTHLSWCENHRAGGKAFSAVFV